MKKLFGKDLLVFWLSLGALVCSAVTLNHSLDRLAKKEREQDD